MTRIVMTVDNEGNSTVKVEGRAGPSCEKATQELQSALGRTTKDVKTAEYYKVAQTAREYA